MATPFISKPVIFKKLRIFVPAALVIFAAGCGGIHVTTDYSHSTNFAQYHTYSWLKVKAPNPLWDSRIERDVNSQLTAKGWMEVPTGGQASVAAFAATKDARSLETFYNSFGPGFGGWRWGGWGGGFGEGFSTTQVVNTPIGSLVVDIFNSSNKQLIWRGYSRRALSNNPNKNEKTLAQAADKMFRNFPPSPKG